MSYAGIDQPQTDDRLVHRPSSMFSAVPPYENLDQSEPKKLEQNIEQQSTDNIHSVCRLFSLN
jgi:hypothetical protein